MPPFYRYYRNYRWRKPYRRQRWLRRRRFRKNIFRKPRRRQLRVRRKFKFYRKRKLKRLKIFQWQPERIRKCRIQGMFSLFQAGYGRYANDYELYRESIVPEHQPGGGGWSIFKISLNNLYQEHQKLLNWWTKSNKDYNLVRYLGVTLKFYRQQETDYVVNVDTNYPFEISKFHFPSSHPERLLMYNKKIIVPSYLTAPLNKKTYIKKRFKPPKQFFNKWYFQNQFCRHGLIMISAAACSLKQYFISDRAENNNVELLSINTEVFSHKNFKNQEHLYFGYTPNSQFYMYGLKNGTDTPKEKEIIYLGNTEKYTDGEQAGDSANIGGTSTYTYNKWGNPFYPEYIRGSQKMFISKTQPTTVLTGNKDHQAKNITEWTGDIIKRCRYNPFTDTGEGNVAKWLNITTLENGWYTDPGPDYTITGFPLWILLWGWEDWTRKLGKLQHLDTDYILVVHTKFINPTLPAYVFISDSWVEGQPPYHRPISELTTWQRFNWYPSWQYQKEAINDLLMSGPGVCKNNSQIQAHMGYNFFFKWGGSPSYVESVADPCSRPDYPIPNQIQQGLEIENPEHDPTTDLYPFDIRRNMLTKKAAERISGHSKTDSFVFTDGTTTTRLPTLLHQKKQKKKKTQEKTTPEETLQTLQQQLHLYKLRKQQLRQRFNQLTKQIQNSKLDIANSE
nr:MAG: ORF1 [TTV-like mini virus]